jgi:probable HAF family extracellular repeat protein
MKSKTLVWITLTILFGVLVVPARLAAQKQIRYAVTDLGTLGGTFSRANGINDNGSVVGLATLTGDTALHAFLWRNGTMTDLGTLAPLDSLPYSQANSINDSDEIVGFSETSTPDPLGENSCGDSLVCLPVIWRNGVIATLPTLGGTNSMRCSGRMATSQTSAR